MSEFIAWSVTFDDIHVFLHKRCFWSHDGMQFTNINYIFIHLNFKTIDVVNLLRLSRTHQNKNNDKEQEIFVECGFFVFGSELLCWIIRSLIFCSFGLHLDVDSSWDRQFAADLLSLANSWILKMVLFLPWSAFDVFLLIMFIRLGLII